MAAALPRNIRLKLQQTLAQWRHWHCDTALTTAPEVVAVLGQGVSNFSVLVGSGPQFVVRIDGINPGSHGLNRQAEWRTLQVAAAAELTPRPCYFNPELTSLVCNYLPPDETQAPHMRDIARLLHAIHQLPARHTRLDLTERILRYEKQLQHAGRELPGAMARCRLQVLDTLGSIRSRSQAAVLCHNDLLQANRIYSGGRLWAIDWEYCAMGSPWYDIAAVVSGDSCSAAQTQDLLQAYLGRPAGAAEQEEVRQHVCIYRYLELLWYLALQHPALDQALLQGKLKDLEAALAR